MQLLITFYFLRWNNLILFANAKVEEHCSKKHLQLKLDFYDLPSNAFLGICIIISHTILKIFNKYQASYIFHNSCMKTPGNLLSWRNYLFHSENLTCSHHGWCIAPQAGCSFCYELHKNWLLVPDTDSNKLRNINDRWITSILND